MLRMFIIDKYNKFENVNAFLKLPKVTLKMFYFK